MDLHFTLLDVGYPLLLLLASSKPKPPTVQQTVKDVLQDLVDDGNVQFDKIGTSNCE